MRRIHTIVIGAGQAGLAMSHCLSERAVPHVVLERGSIANSWKTERWDSLRLLTPNWQSRLPGYRYTGPDQDGFMTMPEISDYLESYASTSKAPIEMNNRVTVLSADPGGYRIATEKGDWTARNVVIATGACNTASVPSAGHSIPDKVVQISPLDYKCPAQLPAGGVLVVGGSATGIQLAAELRRAGHEVFMSVGEHIRMPRHYRGHDIQWWLDVTGLHTTPLSEVDDIARVRRLPSLQLTGQTCVQFTDLNALQRQGVRILGRLAAVTGGVAKFSGGLNNVCALADLKMNRLLDTLDAWAETSGTAGLSAPERFAPTQVPADPVLSLDLRAGRITTVIWATGFRPDHRFIDLPVFDRKGRLSHQSGVVAPGLFVLGLPFLRRRNSALIDGVGEDARYIADQIVFKRGARAA